MMQFHIHVGLLTEFSKFWNFFEGILFLFLSLPIQSTQHFLCSCRINACTPFYCSPVILVKLKYPKFSIEISKRMSAASNYSLEYLDLFVRQKIVPSFWQHWVVSLALIYLETMKISVCHLTSLYAICMLYAQQSQWKHHYSL